MDLKLDNVFFAFLRNIGAQSFKLTFKKNSSQRKCSQGKHRHFDMIGILTWLNLKWHSKSGGK